MKLHSQQIVDLLKILKRYETDTRLPPGQFVTIPMASFGPRPVEPNGQYPMFMEVRACPSRSMPFGWDLEFVELPR